jgi:multidrug efflux pump subunit AcrA (membrane-fusion protein)
MKPRGSRGSRAVAAAGLASVISWGGLSRAEGTDDHAAAMALVAKIEQDPAHAPITAEATTHAKDALERATRLRSTGDEPHAKAADGLAREWAETARDLARATDEEVAASNLRRKAVEAQAQLERARALVEEGIARIGRLRSEVEEAGRGPTRDRTAIEVHDGDHTARKKPEEKPTRPSPDRGERP